MHLSYARTRSICIRKITYISIIRLHDICGKNEVKDCGMALKRQLCWCVRGILLFSKIKTFDNATDLACFPISVSTNGEKRVSRVMRRRKIWLG